MGTQESAAHRGLAVSCREAAGKGAEAGQRAEGDQLGDGRGRTLAGDSDLCLRTEQQRLQAPQVDRSGEKQAAKGVSQVLFCFVLPFFCFK